MYNASPKAKQKPYISIILRIQMILQNSLLSDKIELSPFFGWILLIRWLLYILWTLCLVSNSINMKHDQAF